MEMQSKVTGKGEPLVLVPGGLTGWLSWEPHAERLSATRKVVRTQLLNVQYGLENRSLPTDYSVETESRALETTLDKLGLTMPLDLVAWSYGAAVTLDYALSHPERVRSLTLIEPPALWVLRTQGLLDSEAKKTMEMLQTIKGDISESQLEQFMKSVGFVPPGKSAREMPQWPLFVQHRQSLRNSPAVVEHEDDLQRLRDFKRPVLLVKGTGSARFLHQIIDALAATLSNVQVVEMPAGHAPQVVSMDRFLERLAIFQAGANNQRQRIVGLRVNDSVLKNSSKIILFSQAGVETVTKDFAIVGAGLKCTSPGPSGPATFYEWWYLLSSHSWRRLIVPRSSELNGIITRNAKAQKVLNGYRAI